ncbi:MAG TPA: ATP-binding protein, partial [Anaerolineae bacterium]|nr:ATP-binding protein [Anaerolineae bacterium]
ATLEEKVIERTEALDKAHAALRHTEKLGALGRLAASVAHEINNPLTGISTYLYLLKQQLPSDARVQANIEVIERQVAAIAHLTKKLQRFSKPAQEQRRPVAISQVAEDVLALVRKNLEQHKIEVTYTCAPDIPPLLASADQLGEVLLNLLLNARDAMPAGGQLCLQITEDAQTVYITVRDTGEGMSPEVQEHIFEPFYTTKGEQGTGLGLAISYRIIQEHGGDISVASAPGAGTTFTIRLPLNAAHTVGEGAETHVYQLENP